MVLTGNPAGVLSLTMGNQESQDKDLNRSEEAREKGETCEPRRELFHFLY